jgi:hypothetical protein
MSLPVPVFQKRLAAAFFVFLFGILLPLFPATSFVPSSVSD